MQLVKFAGIVSLVVFVSGSLVDIKDRSNLVNQTPVRVNEEVCHGAGSPCTWNTDCCNACFFFAIVSRFIL